MAVADGKVVVGAAISWVTLAVGTVRSVVVVLQYTGQHGVVLLPVPTHHAVVSVATALDAAPLVLGTSD